MAEADTVLQLEDFQFARLEIPSRIPVGGAQQLVVHQLVGGVRIVDSLGREDRDIEWSGYFLGEAAVSRARYIDNLRIAGQAVALTWDEYNYQVIIKSFECDYEAFYRLPYRIVCEVVLDNTTTEASADDPNIDDAVNQDAATAAVLAAAIADAQLNALVAQLTLAIEAIAGFANAPRSVVNTVLVPLVAVTARALSLTSAGNASIGNAAGFAGIVIGAQPSVSASALTSQITTMVQLNNLYQLLGVCGRIGNNLDAVGSSDNVVTTAGGNLFQVASQQYGDATAWTGIAKANGLTDPQIHGVQTLAIPSKPDNSGGVLSA